MKRLGLLLIAALVVAGLATRPSLRASESYATLVPPPIEPEALVPRPDELIVQFKDAADDRMAERAIREAGGARAQRSAFGRRYLVTVDAGFTAEDAIARLRSMPEVDYAERNGVLRAFQSGAGRFTPNDPLFSAQWHMRMVDAERTWGIQKGDPSVAVAVLDSGIAYEDFGPFRRAPDFGGTIFLPGFNVFSRDSHANDDNFHGTHVASTIAESTNNSLGVAGLAFGCALMPVKVLDSRGVGGFFGVAEGIDYAVNFTQSGARPVKVINLSLGGESSSETVTRAIDRAVAAEVVVVAAAGNENRGTVSFPASLPKVIAVGAVDGRKQRAPYSNFGADVDVVAPGGDVDRDDDRDGRPDGVLQQTFSPTTARTGRFDDFRFFFVQGTSQATPHVAAMAALLVKQGITDAETVKKIIESTAEDLGATGRDDTFGHGLIRPSVALTGLGVNR